MEGQSMYWRVQVQKYYKQAAIVMGCLMIAFVLYLLIDIEARLRNLESDVYAAEARVDAVKSELESIKSNVSSVETKVSDAEAALGAIRTRNKSVKSDLRERVCSLESDMVSTKSRVEEMASDLISATASTEKMAKLEARMCQLESTATILMLDIKSIKSNIREAESKVNAIEFSSARSRLAREMLR